jgi:outer membrane protein assembly factor BamB
MQLARESGEVLVADELGGLYCLDRTGRYSSVTRVREPVTGLTWSDDGQFAYAILGQSEVHRFDRQLQALWKLELQDECLAVATEPFGQYVAIGLSCGLNLIYDGFKRRVARFDSIRPLTFLRFLASEALLVGSADHGLLCCHALSGERLWEEKLWSSVGDLTTTGAGDLIYLAGHTHGVQTFDGHGDPIGSYVVEGTVNHLAASYDPNRLIVSTLERHLYWLDADGELLWSSSPDDDVRFLACDAFGELALCGFASGNVVCLDWSRK